MTDLPTNDGPYRVENYEGVPWILDRHGNGIVNERSSLRDICDALNDAASAPSPDVPPAQAGDGEAGPKPTLPPGAVDIRCGMCNRSMVDDLELHWWRRLFASLPDPAAFVARARRDREAMAQVQAACWDCADTKRRKRQDRAAYRKAVTA